MKLRKMITVSAAALMLAGVGASAANAGAPVHASRRTVRISRLDRQKMMLNRQIRRDHNQVKRINREIARLSHKNIRRGKRSKRTVRRRKRNKRATTKRQPKAKVSPVVKRGKADKQQGTFLLKKGNQVYTFNVTKKGLPITSSEKRVMSVKQYHQKYDKALNQQRMLIPQLITMYKKNPKKNMKYYMYAIQVYQSIKHFNLYSQL